MTTPGPNHERWGFRRHTRQIDANSGVLPGQRSNKARPGGPSTAGPRHPGDWRNAMSMPIIPASDLEGEAAGLPPHDDSAEMVVLGAMLSSRDAIDEAADLLDPDDFYRGRHRAIYEAILALHREDKRTDAVSVGGELERRGEFLRVGAAPYRHAVIEFCPSAANVAYHAERVQEKATARKLVEYGNLLAAHAAQ